MRNKKKGFLQESFERVFGNGARYITGEGAMFEAKPLDQFLGRAEIKSAVATMLCLTFAREAMDTTPEILGSVAFFAGGLALVAGVNKLGKSIEEIRVRTKYGRDIVIDLSPNKNQFTSPDDLAATMKWQEENRQGKTVGIFVYTAGCALAGIANDFTFAMTGPDLHILTPVFGAMAGVGVYTAFRYIVEQKRLEDILDGKYVILEDKPKAQEEREFSPINIKLPALLPAPAPQPAPIPLGS